jgi:myo-inositol-1(or 4)-monophosphatase
MDMAAVMRTAVRAAYAGADVLRSRWQQPHSIGSKGPNDLVTDADIASEETILAAIRSVYPQHGITAEESGSQPSSSAERWLVDPLDGTVNYAHRVPFFAVSIAFACGDEVLAGVVLNPLSGELFSAQAGTGAFLNGEPIAVGPETRLADSLLATGFPYDRSRGFDAMAGRLLRILQASRGIRRFGSAALDLCFVACGRYAGYWEKGLQPWDSAAGALIVREAGGRTTDFSNRPFGADGREVLATNGRIHAEMLALLQSAPPPGPRRMPGEW